MSTEWLFVNTTYYLLLAGVLCWVGTHLHVARDRSPARVLAWSRENARGLFVALGVTLLVALAVEPALRVLSDEANLVGTSKNLFASKSPTFTVSGKNYYGSYWDIDVAIDRRPTLFPFLVSLVHTVLGYSYRNAFHLNLIVLGALLFTAYRLARSLGGETFGVVAALLVAAHPTLLVSARSGGFDLLAAFFAVLVLKSLLDVLQESSPGRLAILWLHLCLFAEVRYETALFLPLVVGLLVIWKQLTWKKLRPYAFVYALTPVYLLPRLCQAILRGNVPEQEPGIVAFSFDHLVRNLGEYFGQVLSPFEANPAHSAVVIALGVLGSLAGLRWLFRRWAARELSTPLARFGVAVAAWVLLQSAIVFFYYWGQARYPSASRLLIPIDTVFSFGAAWVLSRGLERFRRFVPVLAGAGLLATMVPVASQHRSMNRLTQTRESAATWSFFERLEDRSILIVTDRPNHFTIMNFGAMSFESARRDPYLLTAFARHLLRDVYVIQQIRLSTGEPLPGYELWPDRKLDAVFEFQNDANVLVRVSRLSR